MRSSIYKFIKNKYFNITLIVSLIYLIYLYLMKIYPFGENTILKCDLYQQYVNFFCYFREVLINHKSLMFSWNLGLANNFFTTFSYYLASPLNLLVIFFKPTNMDTFVEILTLIKIILIANSAVFYLSKSYNYKKNDVIMFGLIYAYSSYVICYSFHIMWLDCLYMLPITLFFIDKYINNNDGKIYPLIICLSYSIWTNYYIGFIVAFFSGIYFVSKYFISNKIKEKNTLKKFIKKLSIFLFAILIAFGISMITFIPTLKQLKGNMSTANTKLLDINYDKIRLFSNVIFNNYVYMFTQKSSMMFSSTLIIVLIPMYYLNKKILLREKIIYSAIIIFMLMPIISPFLNKLWHGFTTPNCFYFRYSFALIFVTIIIAFREYQNIKYSRKFDYIISFLTFIVLTTIEIIFKNLGYLESDGYSVSTFSIILSAIMYLLFFIVFYLIGNIKKDKFKKILKILLFVIIIIDLLIGAKSGQDNDDKYFKRETFAQYDLIMEKISSKLERPEFERIIFEPDIYGSNMSMKYGYSNIGFFTSARNRKTIKSMYGLGYNIQRESELWITSFSGTFFNYDLAGVRFYITKNKFEDNEIYGFKFIESYDGYNIYENKNYFNIGYYLANNINSDNKNQFEIQNEFLDNLINKNNKKEYFEEIENSHVLNCNKKIVYNESSNEYTVEYKIHSKEDTNIYVCSDNNLQVYINENAKFKDYANIWSFETGIKQIKHLKPNEDFEFKLTTKADLDTIFVYSSNNNNIQDTISKKDNNKLNNVQISSDGLLGTTDFKEDGFLTFTINYDKGWKAYIDGNQVETEAIAGSFLGVKVDKGIHEIKINYEPDGYGVGFIITIICSIILIFCILVENNIAKKQKLI